MSVIGAYSKMPKKFIAILFGNHRKPKKDKVNAANISVKGTMADHYWKG